MFSGATNISSCEPTVYSSACNDSLIRLMFSASASTTVGGDASPTIPPSTTITNQDLSTILAEVINIVDDDFLFPDEMTDDLFTTNPRLLQGGQHVGVTQSSR